MLTIMQCSSDAHICLHQTPFDSCKGECCSHITLRREIYWISARAGSIYSQSIALAQNQKISENSKKYKCKHKYQYKYELAPFLANLLPSSNSEMSENTNPPPLGKIEKWKLPFHKCRLGSMSAKCSKVWQLYWPSQKLLSSIKRIQLVNVSSISRYRKYITLYVFVGVWKS